MSPEMHPWAILIDAFETNKFTLQTTEYVAESFWQDDKIPINIMARRSVAPRCNTMDYDENKPRISKLTGVNYRTWEIQASQLLKAQGLYRAISEKFAQVLKNAVAEKTAQLVMEAIML